MRSKDFSFRFTKDVSKFLILGRDISEARSIFSKGYGACLNI